MLSAWNAKISTSVTSSAVMRDRLESRQERLLEPVEARASGRATGG